MPNQVTLTLTDDQVAAIQHQIGGGPIVTPTPNAAQIAVDPDVVLAYPDANGFVHVGGVNLQTNIPINVGWKPSMQAWMVGHLPKEFVFEPSDGAKSSRPTRSPKGFPLVWGSPPAETPTVLWGERTYPSDADVLSAIRGEVLTPAQIAANQAAWVLVFQRMGQ